MKVDVKWAYYPFVFLKYFSESRSFQGTFRCEACVYTSQASFKIHECILDTYRFKNCFLGCFKGPYELTMNLRIYFNEILP